MAGLAGFVVVVAVVFIWLVVLVAVALRLAVDAGQDGDDDQLDGFLVPVLIASAIAAPVMYFSIRGLGRWAAGSPDNRTATVIADVITGLFSAAVVALLTAEVIRHLRTRERHSDPGTTTPMARRPRWNASDVDALSTQRNREHGRGLTRESSTTTRDLRRRRYWDRTSDLCRVKVPGGHFARLWNRRDTATGLVLHGFRTLNTLRWFSVGLSVMWTQCGRRPVQVSVP